MNLEPIQKLSKDLRVASKTLSDDEARYLVDAYYQMQDNRIRTKGQIRSQNGEPCDTLKWLAEQDENLEGQIKIALECYVRNHPVGEWLIAQHGIGAVISAGLLANIDITKAPTVGHIWSFAGLDPRTEWKKGERRPWNAALKRLCWLAGECFVKTSNSERSFYGKLYRERKEYEIKRNEAGELAEYAQTMLGKKRFGDATLAKKRYLEGKLPDAQIHARARRWAVKIFLSHLHAEMYRRVLNQEPPKPFAIAILNHAHMIEPPKPN